MEFGLRRFKESATSAESVAEEHEENAPIFDLNTRQGLWSHFKD